MQSEKKCPKCDSEAIYLDGTLWVCAECSNEWVSAETTVDALPRERPPGVYDAHGNVLATGDCVTVIKDLKVKGSSSVVKVGTKVKNIRIIDGEDGHNITCRIEGFGAMNLKSEFVKKA